jgi:DNA-binding transcriptional ArsR family regulator
MITINNRLQKENLYNLFAQITTAIANPHRLELLDLLVQAPRAVEELAREAHMSIQGCPVLKSNRSKRVFFRQD